MTRREFLGAGVAFAALGSEPAKGVTGAPIRSVEVFPLTYPVTSYFKFLPKPERPSAFVKIACEDGVVGWGQSVPLPTWSYETLESATVTLRGYLAPALIGRDPLDIEGAHKAMDHAIAPSFSTGMPITKAGIDLALHDIAGKVAKKSLPELWDKQPLTSIRLSWTVNVTHLADVEHRMAEARKLGYRDFNIKISPDPAFDLSLAREVRRLAPRAFLWADANGGYDTDTALTLAPKLRDAGVDVLEQPVAPNNLSGLDALKKQGALPIILDEGVVSVADLKEFHRLHLLDGVAIKPARTAGLFDARRQVEYLRENGLMFLGSGLTDPDLSLAASLILFGAYGLQRPAALNGPQFLAGSYLRNPFTVKDGEIEIPTGVGLGVSVDEEKVRRASIA